MTAEQARTLKPGNRLLYNDGREGHRDVGARVLFIGRIAVNVQFDDRADSTLIPFADRAWMDYLRTA